MPEFKDGDRRLAIDLDQAHGRSGESVDGLLLEPAPKSLSAKLLPDDLPIAPLSMALDDVGEVLEAYKTTSSPRGAKEALRIGKTEKISKKKRIEATLVAGDFEHTAGIHAEEIGERSLTRRSDKATGFWGTFVDRAFTQNLLREFNVRNATLNKRREILLDNNMFAGRKGATVAETRAMHERVVQAVLKRGRVALENHQTEAGADGLRKGEWLRVGGESEAEQSLSLSLEALVSHYAANPNLDETSFNLAKSDIMRDYAAAAFAAAANNAKEQDQAAYGARGEMIADNIWEQVERLRPLVAHEGGIENVDLEINLALMGARAGAETEIQKTYIDNILKNLENSGGAGEKLGLAVRWVPKSALVGALGSFGAYALGGLAGAAMPALVVGGAATLGVVAYQEYVRRAKELQLHERERAEGQTFDKLNPEQVKELASLYKQRDSYWFKGISAGRSELKDIERRIEAIQKHEITKEHARRDRVERFALERVSAAGTAGSLRALSGAELEGLSEEQRRSWFESASRVLADAEARVRVGDQYRRDLFSYTSLEAMEEERLQLLVARGELKSRLRSMYVPAEGDTRNYDEYLRATTLEAQDATDARMSDEDRSRAFKGIDQLHADIAKNDAAYKAYRQKVIAIQTAFRMTIGYAVGTVATEILHEAASGLGLSATRGIVDMMRGTRQGATSETALAHVAEWFKGHFDTVPGPMQSVHFGNGVVEIPAGAHLTPGGNGTFTYSYHGTTVRGLHPDGSGGFDAASLDALQRAGVPVHAEGLMAGGSHTETVTMPTDQWLKTSDVAGDVHHLNAQEHYVLGTPTKFEGTEQLLHWGGDHGTGIGVNPANGKAAYVLDVSQALGAKTWASVHGGHSLPGINPLAAAREGHLQILLFPDKHLADMAVSVPVTVGGPDSGHVYIDMDSALGKFFSVDNGHAVSDSWRMVLAHVDGSTKQLSSGIAENFRSVAMAPGAGMPTVGVEQAIPDYVMHTSINPGGARDLNIWPGFVPLYGRAAMERLTRDKASTHDGIAPPPLPPGSGESGDVRGGIGGGVEGGVVGGLAGTAIALRERAGRVDTGTGKPETAESIESKVAYAMSEAGLRDMLGLPLGGKLSATSIDKAAAEVSEVVKFNFSASVEAGDQLAIEALKLELDKIELSRRQLRDIELHGSNPLSLSRITKRYITEWTALFGGKVATAKAEFVSSKPTETLRTASVADETAPSGGAEESVVVSGDSKAEPAELPAWDSLYHTPDTSAVKALAERFGLDKSGASWSDVELQGSEQETFGAFAGLGSVEKIALALEGGDADVARKLLYTAKQLEGKKSLPPAAERGQKVAASLERIAVRNNRQFKFFSEQLVRSYLPVVERAVQLLEAGEQPGTRGGDRVDIAKIAEEIAAEELEGERAYYADAIKREGEVADAILEATTHTDRVDLVKARFGLDASTKLDDELLNIALGGIKDLAESALESGVFANTQERDAYIERMSSAYEQAFGDEVATSTIEEETPVDNSIVELGLQMKRVYELARTVDRRSANTAERLGAFKELVGVSIDDIKNADQLATFTQNVIFAGRSAADAGAISETQFNQLEVAIDRVSKWAINYKREAEAAAKKAADEVLLATDREVLELNTIDSVINRRLSRKADGDADRTFVELADRLDGVFQLGGRLNELSRFDVDQEVDRFEARMNKWAGQDAEKLARVASTVSTLRGQVAEFKSGLDRREQQDARRERAAQAERKADLKKPLLVDMVSRGKRAVFNPETELEPLDADPGLTEAGRNTARFIKRMYYGLMESAEREVKRGDKTLTGSLKLQLSFMRNEASISADPLPEEVPQILKDLRDNFAGETPEVRAKVERSVDGLERWWTVALKRAAELKELEAANPRQTSSAASAPAASSSASAPAPTRQELGLQGGSGKPDEVAEPVAELVMPNAAAASSIDAVAAPVPLRAETLDKRPREKVETTKINLELVKLLPERNGDMKLQKIVGYLENSSDPIANKLTPFVGALIDMGGARNRGEQIAELTKLAERAGTVEDEKLVETLALVLDTELNGAQSEAQKTAVKAVKAELLRLAEIVTR